MNDINKYIPGFNEPNLIISIEGAKTPRSRRPWSGISKNPLYSTWHNINKRCYDKFNNAYKNYGQRGINNFWKHNPEGFFKYIKENLGKKTSKEYSLDRINNDGNYEPGNLRWATRKQQNENSTKQNERELKGLKKRD